MLFTLENNRNMKVTTGLLLCTPARLFEVFPENLVDVFSISTKQAIRSQEHLNICFGVNIWSMLLRSTMILFVSHYNRFFPLNQEYCLLSKLNFTIFYVFQGI